MPVIRKTFVYTIFLNNLQLQFLQSTLFLQLLQMLRTKMHDIQSRETK